MRSVLSCSLLFLATASGFSANKEPSIPLADSAPLATNPPVNPWAKESDLLWIGAEALLWQAVEDNLQYAYTAPNVASGPETRDFKNPHFDWNWGYRVAVGYDMPHDGWDAYLMYTRCQNHAHGTVRGVAFTDPQGDDRFVFQAWGQAHSALAGNITIASGSWRSDLDQFDLNLGRTYFVGKHLTLRPNVGLRTTWLFQKYDVDYTNQFTIEQKVDLKNRFWGMGLAAGVDSNWLFGAGFSLYGGVDISLLCGFFDVDQQARQEGSEIWKTEKSFRSGNPIFDVEMGIKWAHLFYRNQMGIAFKAGYEYHLYWNQNQFVSARKNSFIADNGNLIYQGIALSIQINF